LYATTPSFFPFHAVWSRRTRPEGKTMKNILKISTAANLLFGLVGVWWGVPEKTLILNFGMAAISAAMVNWDH
jgi:hypothetical protein